ncbi:MAG: hypothetical protein HOV81_23630 [Kofleriaceae bacterium]|nr:hypothetical protein [Kofleriaceae bacterium]
MSGSIVVRTPFELIRALEENASISTAILADVFAGELVIARFLRQQYPHLQLVTVPGDYSEDDVTEQNEIAVSESRANASQRGYGLLRRVGS